MKNNYILALLSVATSVLAASDLLAQCTLTNATSCVCETTGQTNCDLLPDITISWKALQDYAGGPSEYSQTDGSNPGRLRVTGSTPNIGNGPLNVRGVDRNGYRWFLCNSDTISIYDPNSTNDYTNSACADMKQLILQRVYHKNGNTMSFTEHIAGTMTYHPTHGHNHVDDWATFSLRSEVVGEPNPLNWPIVGTGAKVGFCLMDYYPCSSGSASGHCRTAQAYNTGTALNSTSNFPNYGLGGGSYNCSQISQGISVGYTDIYGETLDGMWVNIPPGTCNGNYWVVMEVDPLNNFVEEDENNNWTAAPVTLTLQVPGGGEFANITSDVGSTSCAGSAMVLTASAGTSYAWSNGATTRSITPNTSGSYTCTVTGQCGVDASDPFTVTLINSPAPNGTGATLSGPGQATLNASGADVSWYDAATGGNMLGTGNQFVSPVISQTTSYWAENEATQTGLLVNVGKQNNSGGGAYGSYDQHLTFNAMEAFVLKSVKVYANSASNRTFQVLNEGGNLIAQTTVNVPAGEQRVQLNLSVPVGTAHRLKVTNAYTDMYRNNNGVAYPYTYAGIVSITGSSAGSAYYYFCYDWEVTGQDVVCTSARTEVVATVTNGFILNAQVALEGPYDPGTGLMNDGLRTSSLIPSVEPYTQLGFVQVGGGGETIGGGVLSVTGSSAIVDWVLVELRSATQPGTIVATKTALLRRDGQIVSALGTELRFTVPQDNYYVAIRHRNHLGTMTSVPISFGPSPVSVDLRNPSLLTWGTNARKTINSTAVLYAGNVVKDNALMYTGGNNDRDPILNMIGGVAPTNTVSMYHTCDTNLDGIVRYTGVNNDRDLILTNIGGVAPTQTRSEQLP
ncbi:MAG: hypothetical protein IPI00_02040 [Flavobacteriales bacterium]|nr:hypothetical protein [Flavobacteriales bacterium]MBK6946090.1 hypothetical protein [Flavobacteriales bacterium]MBK7238965.1 hypothetical protein [Flavobacteriales bacterium]MBK7296852.1 hypothetical protein [Flavobacteriales bacterium]MBK9536921.1 hypothetical protein [Flavobacteriales bacterium]